MTKTKQKHKQTLQIFETGKFRRFCLKMEFLDQTLPVASIGEWFQNQDLTNPNQPSTSYYITPVEEEVLTASEVNNPKLTVTTSLNNTVQIDLNETIINCVQNFPILWDKSCTDFKNAAKKKLVWGTIAKELNLNGELFHINSCVLTSGI